MLINPKLAIILQ